MLIGEGGSATVSDCLIEDNTELGINVWGIESQTEVYDTIVRNTEPVNGHGFGMQVGDHASAMVSNSLFEGNTGGNIVVADSGTELEISGCVVRHRGDYVGDRRGMHVNSGSLAMISGCLFDDNSMLGIFLTGSGTAGEVAGTIVRDTRPDEQGDFGMGIVAEESALVSIVESLVSANHTTGLMADDTGTVLRVTDCAIIDVQTGRVEEIPESEPQAYGDGSMAGWGAEMEISRSVVTDNARAGIYYHKSSGKVSDSVVRNNASYGLAMHECEQYVEYKDGVAYAFGDRGNYIFGNGFGLPEDQALQITASPLGLQAPELPDYELFERPEAPGG